MIFHVLSQHHWESCEGTRQARGEDVPPLVERQKWIEGNDKVKVLEPMVIKRSIGIMP
jgi:hypothetical protein